LTGAGAVGGSLLASARFSDVWARNLPSQAVLQNLRNQILAIQAMPAWTTVRQLLVNVATDPALPVLTKTTLQTAGTSLTGFQRDLLEALLVMTTDPAALAATITGTPLTKAQRFMMNRVMGTLSENPAIHRLIQAGAQLKGHPAALQSDVDQVIANSRLSVPSLSIPNNLPLAAVVGDNLAVLNSSAFGQIQQALIPILQNPDFVAFLRPQSPVMVASFMPPATMIALELPGGVDPILPPLIFTTLQVLGAIAGVILALLDFIALPEEAVVVLTVVAFEAAVTYLSQKLVNLLGDSDGDNDGD